ncbi:MULTISPECIES: hypothetical protein [Pseudomonas]|uniref:Uncharacterized protein n=1 Tax=Pseudomonas chlororaphis TaxID=587753 RepID=A0A0D5Y149_9PSED|nr:MULTISPECIES: hypothetical protein [Pseudomonas]AJO78124.1 hypothetical protein TO66_12740 [Pseudomonas sp. MRSN 12121]AKA25041.1 hypothetical protein PCL1606_35900 [Pseudomonas chlororaphis]MCB2254072.1 hypothetical protein [Pseudomonas chlororaphis]
MTRKIFTSRSALAWLVGLLLANTVLLAVLLFNNASKGYDMKMIKTKEPLLIESPTGDDNYYVLPVGTTLYREKSFPEGHDRYVVYLNHKGNIAHEEVPMKPEYGGQLIDPLWVSNVDADTLKVLFNRFPLSKDDVVAAIKSNEITRDDLADIIRSLP